MNDDHNINYLGAGTRLDSLPTDTLVNVAFQNELISAKYLYEGLSYADIAHTIMLIEEKIIPQEAGKALLEGLVSIHDPETSNITLDPKWGDLYNNRDSELQKRLGDKAGWLHAGRARREALTIAWLIYLRSECIALMCNSIKLVKTINETALKHVTSVMPDFTYLQHAQPTTLGHFLLGFAYPLLRDTEQLRQLMPEINSCPAGSASTNGTRLPLNRDTVRQLLGFEQLTIHNRDAMWRTDVPINLMAVLVSLATTLGRIAEEFQIWATAEFNFLELSDRHCRTSVIMPNKKNPYTLSYIRGKARELDGCLISVITTNQTPSGQIDNRNASYEIIPKSLEAVNGLICLMDEVFKYSIFNTDKMRQQAENDFIFATELTDLLMEKENIDSRKAHNIVGKVVSILSGGDYSRDGLKEKLPEIFHDTTGDNLKSDINDFLDALSPEMIINNRRGIGSCSPESVRDMAKNIDKMCNNIIDSIKKYNGFGDFKNLIRAKVSEYNKINW